MAQYIYGKLKSSGEIISICDVPKDRLQRKPWACICPQCGTDLMARRGEIKEDHFAHKPSSTNNDGGFGCSAETANETALHQMAKEILLKEIETGPAQIVVPPVEFFLHEMGYDDFPHDVLKALPHKLEYQKATSLLYTKASLEEWGEGFRPDVIIETPNGAYLIEICVTHPVDAEKAEKAKRRGIPMIEIDLWDVYAEPISGEALRERILTSSAHKSWVVRPNDDAVLDWGHKYYKGNPLIREYHVEVAEKKKAERRRDELFQPDNYKAALKSLEDKRLIAVNSFWFNKLSKNIPFFVNIPIRGESVFMCDRRVWQGAIFDHFIYNRKPENHGVYLENIFRWIKQYQNFFEVDWSLVKGCSLLEDVIKTYLRHLFELGFISDFTSGNKHYTIRQTHSIIAPNQEYAAALMSAIIGLGEEKYSPNVGKLLSEKLEGYYAKRTAKALEAIAKADAAQKAAKEAANQRKIQAQKEAQERARAEKENELRQAKEKILAGKPILIHDENGDRLALCTRCGKMTRARGMRYEAGSAVKGICFDCLTHRKQRNVL